MGNVFIIYELFIFSFWGLVGCLSLLKIDVEIQ
jgi:hypothetical protein